MCGSASTLFSASGPPTVNMSLSEKYERNESITSKSTPRTTLCKENTPSNLHDWNFSFTMISFKRITESEEFILLKRYLSYADVILLVKWAFRIWLIQILVSLTGPLRLKAQADNTLSKLHA